MGHAVHPGNLTQDSDNLYEPFASQMKILEMDQISVPLTARACQTCVELHDGAPVQAFCLEP